jgi:hypothetical protein
VTSTKSDDDSVESTQPAEHSFRLWWAACTLCGTESFGGVIPVFGSRTAMWATLEGFEYGWSRRDDGRVLCRPHSAVADCDREGHDVTRWYQHPIEPDLQWRHCRRCGAQFDQRLRGRK